MEDEVGQIARGEDQVGAEWRGLAGNIDVEIAQAGAGSKPALLVEFAVVRQEGFRHHPEQPAARDDRGAIIQPTIAPQRNPDQQDRAKRAAGGNDIRQRGLGCIEQRVLQQEIVDRIGRQAKLGKHRQVDAAGIGVARQRDRRGDIGRDIGGRCQRRARHHPHETVTVNRHELITPTRHSGNPSGHRMPAYTLKLGYRDPYRRKNGPNPDIGGDAANRGSGRFGL